MWTRGLRFQAGALTPLLVSGLALGEPAPEGDAYELVAHAESHAQLFRRALLPGPNGSLVETQTQLPLQQFVSLAGYGFDTPLGVDSLDVELAAWGSVQAADTPPLGRYDGDVQTASVRLRPPERSLNTWLRLGRQQVAGGAARFSSFDGAHASLEVLPALTLGAYAGWTVLPRWARQRGYYHLGALPDSLVRDAEFSEDAERAGHWLAGGRILFAHRWLKAGASFHEQREQSELGRRNFGLDVSADSAGPVAAGGSLLVELDSGSIADLRLWGDAALGRSLDFDLEYLRTEPALLLSRQSVLSVFGSDGYHEAGGTLTWRMAQGVSVASGGFVQLYDDRQPGARFDGQLRFVRSGRYRTHASLGYARVLAPDNGYHSLRAVLSRELLATLTGTLQFYAYFYDEAIQGYSTSNVYSATLEHALLENLDLLWGGSLARSPYASLDASTQLRLSYRFDAPARRHSW